MPLDQSIIRITKELGALQRASDLSLAVACRDIDVRSVRALIIGPHKTPYEFGFYEFSVKFNNDYPSKAPHVVSITTEGGRCRFNPNIYSNGKVCLSILGTWRGTSGEEWSSAQGLESILISIQSLMSGNPYENEPGFENATKESDRLASTAYAEKITHENLRITVIARLENYLGLSLPPGDETTPAPLGASQYRELRRAAAEDASAPSFTPFEDLCKTRFLWYYDCYCETIRKGKELGYDGKAFKRMPFESAGNNSMDGVFDYAGLERRIQAVKKALDDETRRWETDGAEAAKVETTVSASLKHQFGQVVNRVKNLNMAHHLTLEDGNPFVWIITYFGQPTTKLDGGLFRIRLTFSPRFPNEQPRARFETKIFHHLVAKDGTACYTPNPSKREDVWTHIQAIFELLDDEDPTYDPRKLINLEASTLYWDGKELGRKMYNRRLRRSAQESLEEMAE